MGLFLDAFLPGDEADPCELGDLADGEPFLLGMVMALTSAEGLTPAE